MITFESASLALVIKDPEFGDSKIETVNTRIQTMMDGSVRTRKATPTKISFRLTFINVTRRKTIETRDFLVQTLGQQVRYTDYNGVSWLGFFTTDPNSFATVSRGLSSGEPRGESNTFSLEFEGIAL